MKIITSPTVRLVSDPRFHYNAEYELPIHVNEAEKIIATGGKVCYDSYGHDGRSVKEHVRSLAESGHFSVIEHANVGLYFGGISRGCSHEIVRHRHFSYSQRSTRYTAEEGAAIVLDPYYAAISEKKIHNHVNEDELRLYAGFTASCSASLDEYARQVKLLMQLNPQGLEKRDLRKWARGKARQLLPHALETRMIMTGNLRAWRHFLILRTAKGAEPEIRRLANDVYTTLKPIAPTVFEDFKETIVDGYIQLTTSNTEAQ